MGKQTDELVQMLISSLSETLGVLAHLSDAELDDLDLDRRVPDDDWTVRQIVEHTLYWERHSIDDLAENKLKSRLPSDRPRSGVDVADPLEGRLVQE